MTPLQKAAKNLLEIFYTTGKPIDVYVYDLRRALEAEQAQQVTVPMTDENVDDLQFQFQHTTQGFQWLAFARAIEAHHGIGDLNAS